MNLSAALDLITEDLLTDNTISDDLAVTLVSGGTWNDEKQPLPALYANQDLAVSAWITQVRDHIGLISDNDNVYIRWIEKPMMDRYQITVMDTKDMHRLVNDRFSVYSRFAIVRRSKSDGE